MMVLPIPIVNFVSCQFLIYYTANHAVSTANNNYCTSCISSTVFVRSIVSMLATSCVQFPSPLS